MGEDGRVKGLCLSAIDEHKDGSLERGGVQQLFFRSETDSINKSNSLTIDIKAVCFRSGLKISTISTNL